MPTLWIVHRDAGRRAVLARLSGSGEDTILGDPTDRLFGGAPPADVVVIGLSGDFEKELEFAHRYAPRLANARWLLVTEGADQADARRLFDTLEAEVVPFPPSAESLRHRIREALTRRVVEPLSERRARDAIAARFARWFARLELPEVLQALDPRLARVPVLIRGERGTGRTVLAHYLHAFGGSTGGALVVVPCTPESRAEDLLAAIGPAARSERARRSLTIVLEDEERLAPAVQREVRDWIDLTAPRVVAHSAWVRWMGTVTESPGDPAPYLDAGLRDALAAIPIHLPPLRESPDRIEALAEDVTAAFFQTTGARPRRLGPDALAVLRQYPWPGNLRELEAVVTRTLVASSSELISAASLRFESGPMLRPPTPAPERRTREPEPEETEPLPAASEPRLEQRLGENADSPALETRRLMDAPGPAPARVSRPPPAARVAPPAELVGDDALRRFRAGLSHVLGKSLVSLRTAANLLPEPFTDPEFRARFGELVQTAVRRMEELLGRLSRGRSFGAPARRNANLSALFDDLVDEARPELERTHPHVTGDEEQLHFALEGLLRKALQLLKAHRPLYLASRVHPHGLRGALSNPMLLRFEGTARIAPTSSAEGVSLSEIALDELLTEAVARAQRRRSAAYREPSRFRGSSFPLGDARTPLAGRRSPADSGDPQSGRPAGFEAPRSEASWIAQEERMERALDPVAATPRIHSGASLRQLIPLAEDLWVVERPQTFYGLPVGTRMTVIRLSGGRLLLHSPVALDSELRAELDAIGRVCFAVAPNRVHHLHAGAVAQVYPEARLWLAPGLERKRPDLKFVAVLGDGAPEEWRGEVDQLFFRGRPYENEVVFLHRASRTLLLCDLAFNFGPRAAAPTRLLMKLLLSYGRFGPSKLDPLLIRDRVAARQSLERILAWDFDRIVVAHGEVLESGGREALRTGYSWLLAAGR